MLLLSASPLHGVCVLCRHIKVDSEQRIVVCVLHPAASCSLHDVLGELRHLRALQDFIELFAIDCRAAERSSVSVQRELLNLQFGTELFVLLCHFSPPAAVRMPRSKCRLLSCQLSKVGVFFSFVSSPNSRAFDLLQTLLDLPVHRECTRLIERLRWV